jgi:hypothetical protein
MQTVTLPPPLSAVSSCRLSSHVLLCSLPRLTITPNLLLLLLMLLLLLVLLVLVVLVLVLVLVLVVLVLVVLVLVLVLVLPPRPLRQTEQVGVGIENLSAT